MMDRYLEEAIENYDRDWSEYGDEKAAATQAAALISIAQSLATLASAAETRPTDMAYWIQEHSRAMSLLADVLGNLPLGYTNAAIEAARTYLAE